MAFEGHPQLRGCQHKSSIWNNPDPLHSSVKTRKTWFSDVMGFGENNEPGEERKAGKVLEKHS